MPEWALYAALKPTSRVAPSRARFHWCTFWFRTVTRIAIPWDMLAVNLMYARVIFGRHSAPSGAVGVLGVPFEYRSLVGMDRSGNGCSNGSRTGTG